MGNYPYAGDLFGKGLKAWPLRAACRELHGSHEKPLESLAAAVGSYYNATGLSEVQDDVSLTCLTRTCQGRCAATTSAASTATALIRPVVELPMPHGAARGTSKRAGRSCILHRPTT